MRHPLFLSFAEKAGIARFARDPVGENRQSFLRCFVKMKNPACSGAFKLCGERGIASQFGNTFFVFLETDKIRETCKIGSPILNDSGELMAIITNNCRHEENLLGQFSRLNLTLPVWKSKTMTGRPYQIAAIRSVLEGIERKRRKFLLVMATGTGKTRTCVSLIDVLMRTNRVQRVLFLVDRIAFATRPLMLSGNIFQMPRCGQNGKAALLKPNLQLTAGFM